MEEIGELDPDTQGGLLGAIRAAESRNRGEKETLEAMMRYPWPGNVEELQAAMEAPSGWGVRPSSS